MIQKIHNQKVLKKKKLTNLNEITHSLKLVSLISPFILNYFRTTDIFFSTNKKPKILVKYSYILFTWFFYFTHLNSTNKKHKLRIFVLPSVLKKFTQTKSPMAQKNWSKEQYQFSYFLFKIKFKSCIKTYTNNFRADSLIYFFLLVKKNLPIFETNLIFLKNYSILIKASNNDIFNYI